MWAREICRTVPTGCVFIFGTYFQVLCEGCELLWTSKNTDCVRFVALGFLIMDLFVSLDAGKTRMVFSAFSSFAGRSAGVCVCVVGENMCAKFSNIKSILI